jgi:transposase
MYPNSSTMPLYVAIDIGKNVHSYAAYAGADLSVVLPPCEVRNDRQGYLQFQTWLSEQLAQGEYGPVIVGLEPTGIYHETWADALQQAFATRIQLRLLNPYQTKQKRQQLQSGRQRKTDAIDDQAIAHCLRDGLGNPFWLRQAGQVRWDLWAADFRGVQRERQRLQVHLLTQLDRLWPGALVDVTAFHKAHPKLQLPVPLVLSRPLERSLVRLILEHAPNPYTWVDCSADQIQAFFRTHGRRCGLKTAQKLVDVVHQALLPPLEVAALLADHLQADFARYRQMEERLDQFRHQAEEWVPASPAAVLTTVPGISAFLAAQYLAYVGDVHRFQSADQIWALAGFDVGQDDSGDRRRVGKISKRGEAGFRLVLFSIGLNTSQYCPVIAQAKQRARAHGKGAVGAVIHAAHKANRICYHLLLHQVPFDPQRAR